MAGPHHLIAAVNRCFWIFDKQGVALDSVDAATWYSTTLPGAAPFDPRLLYDHFANRFLMLWHHRNVTTPESYYLLSVSDTDDPLGTWSSWALPASVSGSTPSDTWADNGCLGFDQDAVYITSDHWDFLSGTFVYATLRIIEKSQLLTRSSGPVAWTDFWAIRDASGGTAFRIRPAVMHTVAGEYYLLEVPDFTVGTNVSLYKLADPISKPVLTAVAIPVTEWSRAQDAEQRGGGVPIDTRRSTLAGEVQYMNGSVYASWPVANPASPTNSCIRYVRISTTADEVAEDVTFGAPGYWYMYPAVAVDAAANVTICFTRSGTTEFPGTYMTWRLASDGPGLRPSVQLQPGWSHYERLDEGGENRWGDYNAAALDPVDRNVFWLMGEYAEAPTSTWGTWIAGTRLSAAPEAEIALDRNVVDFGLVPVPRAGDPVDTIAIALSNAGTPPLFISAPANGNVSFAVTSPTAFPVVLSSGDRMLLHIACIPGSEGPLLDTLRITSNDPIDPTLKVVLRATARTVSRARTGTLYGIRADLSGAWLYTLDSLGGAAAVGSQSSFSPRSLSVNPANGLIYTLADDRHGSALVRLDASTGEGFPHRVFALPDLTALAFAPDGSLYGGTRSGGMYRLSTTVSEAVLIGENPGLSFSALSFAPDTTLWASAGEPYGNDTVYAVNTASGRASAVGATGLAVHISGITHEGNGSLLALVENALFNIDPKSWKSSFITYYGVEGLRSIAMMPDFFTSVDSRTQDGSPARFALAQNYPNPFNPSTTISYELPDRVHVSLRVFSLLGQEVARLVDEDEEPGWKTVTWAPASLASGIYLYRLRAGRFVAQKRMVLLR